MATRAQVQPLVQITDPDFRAGFEDDVLLRALRLEYAGHRFPPPLVLCPSDRIVAYCRILAQADVTSNDSDVSRQGLPGPQSGGSGPADHSGRRARDS